MKVLNLFFAQIDLGPLPHPVDTSGTKIVDIINTTLVILGSIAVLSIILAGIRYIVSRGDSQAITKAKNTILYAVIGLVICMTAATIVNFALRGL